MISQLKKQAKANGETTSGLVATCPKYALAVEFLHHFVSRNWRKSRIFPENCRMIASEGGVYPP
jgi:hypothetical protein